MRLTGFGIGASMVKRDGKCSVCHTGKEASLGNKIVNGGPLEPAPVKGKNGALDLQVQVANDAKNACFRLQWPTADGVRPPVLNPQPPASA